MKVILDKQNIDSALDKLSTQIVSSLGNDAEIAVIGIRSMGEFLAKRLTGRLSKSLGKDIPCGTLDITLYRDDINDPQNDNPMTVRSSEIPFDVSKTTTILVDDVLYTGRSTRSAMDALMSFGRCREIKLAVLIDRGHRELPIQADFAAETIEIPAEQSVVVNLIEAGDIDQVIVE